MLGGFHARRGETEEAEAEYQAALRLSPAYGPAAANLADLYRQLGRDADAESVLRQALEASPQDAGLHHALGLTLVRLKRQDEAIAELARAAELEPDRARYAYVYAIGLDSMRTPRRRDPGAQGQSRAASEATATRCRRWSASTARRRDFASALHYAEQLAEADPNNAELKGLIETLRGEAAKPAP